MLLMIVHLFLGWRRLRDQAFQGVFEVRIDGAHYTNATCTGLPDARGELSVSVPFERLPRLKAIVEKRTPWHRIDDEWSYFKWSWRPGAKSRCSFSCVIHRRRVAQRRTGLRVQGGHDQRAPVAHVAAPLPRRARIAGGPFAEAKSQLGLGYLPSRREVGNQICMLCNLSAHALGREIQMRAAPPRSKNTATRACLWTLEGIETMRNRLIKRAARVIHPRGRLVLSCANCPGAESACRRFTHAASNAA